jgi:hypothetical protein
VVLREVWVEDVPVEASYADVFVVVREGEDAPGPSDWEVHLRTELRQRLPPGRHELRAVTADDVDLRGCTLLRFSDGHRHLFRGDGALEGAARVIAP